MHFVQDLRYALRNLLRGLGFLLLVVTTLGLGISANAKISIRMLCAALRSE